MARTRTRRLNRFQRRRLRNPLPPDDLRGQIVVEAADKEQAFTRLNELMRRAEAYPAYREFVQGTGKMAPVYLVMQGMAPAQQHASVRLEPEVLAVKLLGLDGDEVAVEFPNWRENEDIVGAVQTLADEIEGLRGEAQSSIAALGQLGQQQQQATSATPPTPRRPSLSAGRKVQLDSLLRLSAKKLAAAINEEEFSAADLNYLAGGVDRRGWKGSTAKPVRQAILNAREFASSAPPAEEPRSELAVTSSQARSRRPKLDIESDEAENLFDDLAGDAGVEDDEPDLPPRADDDPGLRRPRAGLGSEGWDPSRMSASTLALGKKIRGSIQREDAKKARLDGFDKYLLKYRRPQARDRSSNLNAPVLYSPPEDVIAKIEEIMAADDYAGERRPGMPQQFQDVLVYVLTSDHLVGRGSRVIPAGSVEVYNKGTLVGTFGKSGHITNLKQALLYAGTLVGADLQRGVFLSSKGSRMRSRILMAAQGEEGWRLIAPSLDEILRGSTPVNIEVTLDGLYEGGTKGFGDRDRKVSNPRRAPVRSIGRTRYVPTSNGYRVLNGKHSGRHYTVNDFGHMCKMALILDHM